MYCFLFMGINNKIMDRKLFNVNIIYQGLFTELVSTRAFSLFLIYRMFLNCVAFINICGLRYMHAFPNSCMYIKQVSTPLPHCVYKVSVTYNTHTGAMLATMAPSLMGIHYSSGVCDL